MQIAPKYNSYCSRRKALTEFTAQQADIEVNRSIQKITNRKSKQKYIDQKGAIPELDLNFEFDASSP